MAAEVIPVGIDVSAKELVVVIGGQEDILRFKNHGSGHKALLKVLKKNAAKQGAKSIRVVLEVTGIYSLALSFFLSDRDEIELHALNPAQVRHYARSQLARSKTDPCDARILADLAANNPAAFAEVVKFALA